MSSVEVEQFTIESINKRPVGRPRKQQLSKLEYNKEYQKQKIAEKGEFYENKKQKIKEYNDRCRKAYIILRGILDNNITLPEDYKKQVQELFAFSEKE